MGWGTWGEGTLKSTLSVCERPYSLLGFGEPGENLYPGRGGREGGEGPQITCQFLHTVSHIL